MEENIPVKVLKNINRILVDGQEDIVDLTDYLVTSQYFNSEDRDFIRKGSTSQTKRAQLERMFDRMLKKDDGVWKAFYEGLQHSKNYELVQLIRNTDCTGNDNLNGLKSDCRSLFHQHDCTVEDNSQMYAGVWRQMHGDLVVADNNYKIKLLERNLQSVLPDIKPDEEPAELTSAALELEKNGSLLIIGPNEEQRQILCQVLLKRFSKDGYGYKNKPIILHDTSEWEILMKDGVKGHIVLLEDILGVKTLSKFKALAWSEILKTLPDILLESQCPLIISLSTAVFDEVKKSDLKQLFEHMFSFVMEQRRRRLTSKSQHAIEIFSGEKTLLRTLSQIGDLPSELHRACFIGDVLNVKEIIKDNEASKSDFSLAGQTPLHVACHQKHANIVSVLLGIEETDLVQYIDGDCLDVNVMLHKAAALGHTKVVEQLLCQGAETGSINTDERVALHLAIINNHVDVIEMLIKNMANVDLVDREGFTPLHCACSDGHEKGVILLLKNGASTDLFDKNGFTPLHVACKEKQFAVVKLLLKEKVSVDQVTKDTKQTSLHIASSCGHVDLVNFLITKGAQVDVVDVKGCTVLHTASESGMLAVVDLLVTKQCVDVNVVDHWGLTPLHKACGENNKKDGTLIIRLLEHGAAKDKTDNKGQSALHHACKEGNIVAISILVKHRANCMLFDHKLNTPLHVACLSGHPGAIQALLFPTLVTNTGLNITVEFVQNINTNFGVYNRAGDTPMHLACRSGLILAVWALLQFGQIFIDTVNFAGDTALHDACSHGHVNIVKTLLDVKARTDIKNHQGMCALHMAVNKGHKQIVHMLIEKKLNVELTDFLSRTALHMASEKGHTQIVQMLIAGGCNVNAKDIYKNTALHCAVLNGQASTVNYLLEHNADPNVVNVENKSPLFHACYYGNQNVADALLECKTLDLLPAEGQKCLEVACAFGYVDIVMSLLKKKVNFITDVKKYPSPLHIALNFNHLEVAHLLLQENCTLPVILESNEQGEHALNKVCALGDTRFLALMLKQRPDVNNASLNGHTALMYASMSGHVSIVRKLLKAGADVNKLNNEGMTPLMFASLCGHEQTVKILLESHAKVDLANKIGRTALYLASLSGSEGVVRQLVQSCNTINKVDSELVTPLCAASANGHANVVKILLRCGAKVDTPNKKGYLPIHCASESGFADVVELLLKAKSSINQAEGEIGSLALQFGCLSVRITGQMAVVDVLLQHKVKVDSAALVAACLVGRTDLLKKLLDRVSKAEMEQTLSDNKNRFGTTPLHTAGFSGHTNIAEILIEFGANVNVVDCDGKTPLFIACESGRVEMAKYLLDKGANADIKSNDGLTALEVSLQHGKQEYADLFSKTETKSEGSQV